MFELRMHWVLLVQVYHSWLEDPCFLFLPNLPEAPVVSANMTVIQEVVLASRFLLQPPLCGEVIVEEFSWEGSMA